MANKKLRPIDAFIKYFNDVKPYRTKLLEIIEKYNFKDEVNVTVTENLKKNIKIENIPLCRPAGFGVGFDDECGFDTDECCDLFQCLGGYGLIFDNSDLLISEDITDIDTTNDIISIAGDHTFDKKINIKSIPNNKTLILEGNFEQDFITNKIFLIVPKNVFPVKNTEIDKILITGNHQTVILNSKEIKIYGGAENTGKYDVVAANFNALQNVTTVQIAQNTLTANLALGFVDYQVKTFNQGAYTVDVVSINGADTIVTVKETFDFTDAPNLNLGAIQLRSGLFNNRLIVLEESCDCWNNYINKDGLQNTDIPIDCFDIDGELFRNFEYKILFSKYDRDSDTTGIRIAGKLTGCPNSGKIKLYGYFFGSGFDENEECSDPKPFNVSVQLSERLIIRSFRKQVTPTVTPTSTITPTLTSTPFPTPTRTRSVTPTASPTSSITPSITATATATLTPTNTLTPTPTIGASPTATPSITPTMTVTPTNTVTATVTASATVTPTMTVTPTNTLTNSPTPTVTRTVTVTPTATMTPTITRTPAVTVTPSMTPTSTTTLTPSITPSNSPQASPTVTPTPTVTTSRTPSVTPSVSPTISLTPTVTQTPSITPSRSGVAALSAIINPSAGNADCIQSGPGGCCTASRFFNVVPSGGSGSYSYSWTLVSGDSVIFTSPTSISTNVNRQECGFSSGLNRSAIIRCTVTDTVFGGTVSVNASIMFTFTPFDQ